MPTPTPPPILHRADAPAAPKLRARLHKQLSATGAEQAVYQCDPGGLPPYVLVSAVRRETMIFPCDADGEVSDWGDLVVIHHMSHADALAKAGYSIVGPAVSR